ncbi:MAG: rod shape-determining protein RodA [SAR324 cluster bacterium]|nr:rod shape-determining protein RodA [SAR324 cluster bacterium]
MLINPRHIEHIDWVLIFTVVTISIVGFAAIYSASLSYGTGTTYFQRQVLWFFAGLLVMALTMAIDYKVMLTYAFWFHLLLILLLVLVLFYGTGSSASKVSRWIKLGPFFVQPSEFVKFSLCLALAAYFRESRRIGDLGLKEMLWPALLTLVPFVLILKQPDLGTAGVLLIIFIPVIFLAGLRIRVIITLGIMGIFSAPLAWFFVLKEYQKARILTLINPESDPLGKGYHIIQSKIAVGSGGVWGKGYLEGTQAQLNFLPARHTDFIFSVFTEEWGFVGGASLVCLYGFFIFWCLKNIGNTKDRSGTILTLSVTTIFAAQILINISMVLGLLPIVGMPLPFMSYGGSAMLSHMIGIGLILNVRMRRYDK